MTERIKGGEENRKIEDIEVKDKKERKEIKGG